LKRTNIVTAFVALLALTAIAAIVGLEQRANANHSAEVRLAGLESDLERLQTAPLRAQKSTGGDPVLAARLLREGKARMRATLDELDRENAPPQLAAASAELAANFAVLDRIYALGASGVGYGVEADRLGSKAAGQTASIAHLLDEAGDAYGRRHERADTKATLSGVGSILALLLVFAFFYRRAAGARAVAERLARQNLRLLAASREEALTDALTGLRNRRALVKDLEDALPEASAERPVVLALFDLDGFKQYNDTFGHPAGDTVLVRLGERLARALDGVGTAYRMGGDEFCVLASGDAENEEGTIGRAADALSEAGEGFEITASHGAAIVPLEARTAEDALRLADQRLYEHKDRRTSAGRETTDVLLQVLSERHGLELEDHLSGVARLARLVAERLGLPDHEVKRIRPAAELHDVGKTGAQFDPEVVAIVCALVEELHAAELDSADAA
jgi:diguanylate cyclase (GGDEF)-like protein